MVLRSPVWAGWTAGAAVGVMSWTLSSCRWDAAEDWSTANMAKPSTTSALMAKASVRSSEATTHPTHRQRCGAHERARSVGGRVAGPRPRARRGHALLGGEG